MIAYIDAHRDQFGVELICRVLRAAIPGFLTSRGYRAARTRPPSDREIRDEQLIADLEAVHRQNTRCMGSRRCTRR
ncbi:integrase core domain protein [Mycobacterium intracellulare ATCC 13950]|uniref:Integrase core domain protein n=1 Tax=Mycobacterium intracellulare (strain ATCC 13950 / DSM 43223 / JCM 6384 / NCTC 13025 / 3600) TaxID=487521 RepID=H8IWH4_MYCIA|nr:integrase core domain protein [Mycobacterium intracellulare ATCC 13950]